jgi:hypothetical protein
MYGDCDCTKRSGPVVRAWVVYLCGNDSTWALKQTLQLHRATAYVSDT